MNTRVGIVEDKDPYREHLAALLGGADGFACVGAHRTAEAALKHFPSEKPDVVLLDLELPRMSGLDLIPQLKARLPLTEILVLTMHKDPQRIFEALERGASGYLVKPVAPAKILEAIADAQAGGSPMSSPIARLVVQTFQKRGEQKKELAVLSSRELEVLELVAKGFQTKEIGEKLEITGHTVSAHLHSIYEKLHVHSRAGATAKYLQSGP